MSHTNGTVTRGKLIRLTHSQHYQLCEMLRVQQEQIQTMYSIKQVHELASSLLPFPVGMNSVEAAVKMLNIPLTIKRQKPACKGEQKVRMSVLSTAVMTLYEKLGEQPTESMKRLHTILNG